MMKAKFFLTRWKWHYTLIGISFAVVIASLSYQPIVHAANLTLEPIQACVVARDLPVDQTLRRKFAECLGWQTQPNSSVCRGSYRPLTIAPLADEKQIKINTDEASLYLDGRSQLKGNVVIYQGQRIVSAQTASIYRDAKTKQVTRIELIGDVRYFEPDRMMIARKAIINPQDNSGKIEDALYRFNTRHAGAILPAWGRANLIHRFANQNYLLQKATYTTCAPEDNAWQIDASKITLDKVKEKGVARNAVLRVRDWPLVYVPYLSFPTSNTRKSGFLMPVYGYSNVSGMDLGLPYYWNIAPNYDATITPHLYSSRGMMLGGEFRFLTESSTGTANANILPQDRAFNHFLQENKAQYPSLRNLSDNRWAVSLHDHTQFNPNLQMGINFQQVSDDYYLQDFSSNLAILTQNQLLREGSLTYTTDHWLFNGMAQSYQTLHPINQSNIADIYERLPQILAQGTYNDLPMHARFNILGQIDNFHWPANTLSLPQGPRYHVNPILSFSETKPWGYVTPSIQVAENYYDVHYVGGGPSNSYNRTIPRYSLDSGLFFERQSQLMGRAFTQTLEPRLFYLNVPYHNQTPVPVFDSAYMIFNYDQLFRTNRFSGFDRIGDANQVVYAATTRWLAEESGREKASFSIGQIRYFSKREVQLCYDKNGSCSDNQLMLGYLSPLAKSSPIASRATYQLNSAWGISTDYVWDDYTHSTNNGNLNFHYQPASKQIINFGYSYLVNGDVTQVANSNIEDSALHQATVAYAWPFTSRWSGLGVYSYNISKQYGMMTFLGLQYDNCCWAVRLMGGRTFKSLSPTTLTPQYNNNVYLQISLKGLGSVASSDPGSIVRTYLPEYSDLFQH